jgi:hypothetical protein
MNPFETIQYSTYRSDGLFCSTSVDEALCMTDILLAQIYLFLYMYIRTFLVIENDTLAVYNLPVNTLRYRSLIHTTGRRCRYLIT